MYHIFFVPMFQNSSESKSVEIMFVIHQLPNSCPSCCLQSGDSDALHKHCIQCVSNASSSRNQLPKCFVCSLFFDSRHVTRKESWCPKRASSIQYGYRKWGTHARVFSQTPAYGNSKIEIRQ